LLTPSRVNELVPMVTIPVILAFPLTTKVVDAPPITTLPNVETPETLSPDAVVTVTIPVIGLTVANKLVPKFNFEYSPRIAFWFLISRGVPPPVPPPETIEVVTAMVTLPTPSGPLQNNPSPKFNSFATPFLTFSSKTSTPLFVAITFSNWLPSPTNLVAVTTPVDVIFLTSKCSVVVIPVFKIPVTLSIGDPVKFLASVEIPAVLA